MTYRIVTLICAEKGNSIALSVAFVGSGSVNDNAKEKPRKIIVLKENAKELLGYLLKEVHTKGHFKLQ